jgi:hypothetical protein
VTATSAKLMMLQNTAVPSRVAVRGAHDGLARQGRQGAARLALLAHQVLTQRYVWRLLTTSSDSPRM